MLSDEEKKAIESLKNIAIYIGDNYTFSQQGIRNLRENLRIVLPVIEKQSKEMEELRNEVMEKELIIDGMKEDRRIAAEEIQEQYFVSKEEAEQREKKAYIDGTNIADELCNKKWNDKIKAKIEELDKMKSNGKYTILFNSDNVMEVVKAFLQSLLEKE